jgi:lysozyme family protein
MRGCNEGYGVNSGVARSGKVLRRILKLSDASSTITDAVVAAACATDAERLVKLICDERLRFLQSLRTWPVFGIGWGRRVADVRSVALKLAADGRTTSSTGALMAGH